MIAVLECVCACADFSVSLVCTIRSAPISQRAPKEVFDFSRRVIRLELVVCGGGRLLTREADGQVAELSPPAFSPARHSERNRPKSMRSLTWMILIKC